MTKEVKQILERLYASVNAPLTFFDIESTGLDKITDEIVQIYLCKYDGKDFIEHNSYYNTNVPIRKEAFEKHGLTKEFLADYPYFIEQANPLFEEYFPKGTVLCGYNSLSFDVPFIIEKFLQSKIPAAVSMLQNPQIDAIVIYRELFPNTLEGVFERLVGGEMGEAHEAKNDIVATIKIIGKLLDLKGDTDLIAENNTVDSDKFFRREGNEIFFAKGKLKDKNILTMDSKEALGFLRWMTNTPSISIHSRTIAKKLMEKIEKIITDKLTGI